MFVEALKRQNPALISAALSLWQQGKIAPDSWVIDVDQVLENGKRLIETARLYGIELYLMTKQFGRNPWLAEKLLALGYSGIVAVDYPLHYLSKSWSLKPWRSWPEYSCRTWRVVRPWLCSRLPAPGG